MFYFKKYEFLCFASLMVKLEELTHTGVSVQQCHGHIFKLSQCHMLLCCDVECIGTKHVVRHVKILGNQMGSLSFSVWAFSSSYDLTWSWSQDKRRHVSRKDGDGDDDHNHSV